MSPSQVPTSPDDDPAELADRVAAAVLACPDVVGLSGGPMGGLGTYLPGRRVTGVRVDSTPVSVHVVGVWRGTSGPSVTGIADQVRDAVRPLVDGRPVDVTVEDLRPPEPDHAPELPAGESSRSASAVLPDGRPAPGRSGSA